MMHKRDTPPREGFRLIFDKRDVNVEEGGGLSEGEAKQHEYLYVLSRAEDENALDAALKARDWNGYDPGIAGLGRNKPLHRLPGSAQTWVNAFEALREAHEIYIIGWSCSEYDTMARFQFASVMRQRSSPPGKTVVVDPKAECLAERLRPVFGPVVTLDREAQDVGWGEVLARS